MTTSYVYEPNYAVHPGETLREKLAELQMTPNEFAIRTGKPIQTVSKIMNGKSAITSDMAVQFEKVLNIPAIFWIKKQANYHEFVAKEKYKQALTEAKIWAKLFPYAEMAKIGLVKPTRKVDEKAEALLNFFDVAKHTAWENIYFNQQTPIYFRISLKHTKNPYALSVLLQMGKREAQKIQAPSFDKAKLKTLLPVLKGIMANKPDNFLELIQEECLTAGVKVVYTSNLKQTVTNGVVRWINDNPVIQMTDRYKRYDIFWFSFFHELGHIFLHGNKKNIFLEEIKATDSQNEQEKEADDFSANILLKKEEYQQVIDDINEEVDILEIIHKYALAFNTHADIIIGRILFKNKDLYKLSSLHKEIGRVDFKLLIG